jgi:hypothetical protein
LCNNIYSEIPRTSVNWRFGSTAVRLGASPVQSTDCAARFDVNGCKIARHIS